MLVGAGGFEPPSADPESAVLPLDDAPMGHESTRFGKRNQPPIFFPADAGWRAVPDLQTSVDSRVLFSRHASGGMNRLPQPLDGLLPSNEVDDRENVW